MIRACTRSKFLILIGLLIFFHVSNAQHKTFDSTQIAQLNAQAYILYLTHSDSAIQLAKKALELATETNNRFQQGCAYMALSKAYWAKANFMLSTDYGFRALKIFEDYPTTQYLILTYVGLGRTLTELGNHTKAREFIIHAIHQANKIQDSLLLTEAHREFSFLYTEIKNYDSAIYYADLGIDFFAKKNLLIDLSILYGRKSRIYYDLQDFEKSREFAYKGIPIDSVTGNTRALSISKFLAAQSEQKFGNRKKAIQLVKRSIQLSEEINNQQWLIRSHDLLASLYKEEGNFLKATEELELVSKYKDSFYNIEKSGQAQEMQALYELDSKEKTIQLLESENTLRQQQVTNQRLYGAVLLISVILLVAVIFFLIRLRRIQEKANQNLSIQKDEIKRQAENLHQLNELKTKLFSVISHDLRGPISSLRALLGLLANKAMTPEEFVTVSAKLKTNIDSTHQTLENLLNWCLAQMQGIKTELRQVVLANAVNEVCNLLQDISQAKGISFQRDFEDHAMAMADPNQLQLILRNLFHNAIKFSRPHTTVNISIKSADGFWKITIQDTGIGMNKEEIYTILNTKDYFSKFGTQQEKGTGLGLMLSKEFINLNNGRLVIESEVEQGTTISVYVPKSAR
jgi:signal transduction histidine kinase